MYSIQTQYCCYCISKHTYVLLVYYSITVVLGPLPTSNSNPFSMKEWQQPPDWSCCSRTSTFLPALAMIAPMAKPPIPLPTMTASRFSGTLLLVKPGRREAIFSQIKSKGKTKLILVYTTVLQITVYQPFI